MRREAITLVLAMGIGSVLTAAYDESKQQAEAPKASAPGRSAGAAQGTRAEKTTGSDGRIYRSL